MRFTRTACTSALTLALALSTAPALAAGDPPPRLDSIPDMWLIKAGPRIVDDRPECAAGQRAVWVNRLGNPGELIIDPRTGKITFINAQLPYEGWECQPIKLVPVEPLP